MRVYSLSGIALVSVVCSACVLGAEDESADIGQVEKALTYTEFSWFKGNPAVNMGTASGRVCLLTQVAGDFDGGGEFVQISISGGNWFLSGGSGTSHTIYATAACRPLDFGTSYSGQFTWTKGGSTVNLPDNGSCFLTRVQGLFNGGGEQVRTWKDSSGQWWLGGTSGASGSLSGSARCIAGESIVADGFWLQGSGATKLWGPAAPSTSVACFLQGMRGKFQGGGEHIETYYNTSLANFYVGGGSGQFGVSAWAGCIF